MNQQQLAGHTLPPPTPPQQERPPEKKPGFWSGFLRSLMTNGLIHLAVNVFGFWSFIPVILALILACFGWKTAAPGQEKPKGLPDIINDAKEKLPNLGNDDGDKPEKGGILPTPTKVIKGGISRKVDEKIDEAKKEVIDPLKELAKRREAAHREKLYARARAVGLKYEESWPTAELQAMVEEAEEQAERQRLTAEATKLRYGVNPSWDIATLRKQVSLVRDYVNGDASYQLKHQIWEEAMERWKGERERGPNARCPQCKVAFRSRADAKHSLKCLRCGVMFSAGRARAFWTPPPPPKEPVPPQMPKGLLGSFFS